MGKTSILGELLWCRMLPKGRGSYKRCERRVSNRDKSNPWTKSLGPLDLGLVQVGLHWCNPWTSYLLDQMYMGTVGD